MLKNSKNVLTTAIIGAITTTLLMTAHAEAKGQGNKFRGQKDRDPAAQFTRLDADQNSVLTLEEFITSANTRTESLFTRKDLNEDGFLTLEEASATKSERQDLSTIAEDIVLCVADASAADETGLIQGITADKFSSSADKFANIDTSGDELLDLTEVSEGRITKATNKFAAIDSNVDGEITEDEFTLAKQRAQATGEIVKSCIEELSEDDVI